MACLPLIPLYSGESSLTSCLPLRGRWHGEAVSVGVGEAPFELHHFLNSLSLCGYAAQPAPSTRVSRAWEASIKVGFRNAAAGIARGGSSRCTKWNS